ncbi:MAG: integrase core domain-containing protein, partial [Pseudomonadota bacterium]
TTPPSPQRNAMLERPIRSLKEPPVHSQRFESLSHATRAAGDRIQVSTHKRPHRAFAMGTPTEAFKSAA